MRRSLRPPHPRVYQLSATRSSGLCGSELCEDKGRARACVAGVRGASNLLPTEPCENPAATTVHEALPFPTAHGDTDGRPRAPATPSTRRHRDTNPETQRLYTEATSQGSVFQKDFNIHWVLLQAGSTTVATVT